MKVGEGTVNGQTDYIDQAVHITAPDGGNFDAIVFTAPGTEDDYLINAITYETAGATDSTAEYAVDITASLNDQDGSEALAVTISGVPDGATLSAGAANDDGTWTVPGDQLDGLKLSVPFNADIPAFTLAAVAVATEAANGDTASSAPFTAEGQGLELPPQVTDVDVSASVGDGQLIHDNGSVIGVSYAIDLSASVNGHENVNGLSVTISGLPDGATLTAGHDNGDGTFTLTPDQFDGLQLVTSHTVEGDFTLDFSAQAADGTLSTTDAVPVDIDTTVYLGPEDNYDYDNYTYGDTTADNWQGTGGSDYGYGSSEGDYLNAKGGDDQVFGGAGNDSIIGGSGNDQLYGGSGNDSIDAGSGDDRVYAGSGNDSVDAGSGNDKVWGGAGNDILNGGSGDDTIDAGSGNDTIDGGDNNDHLFGGLGDDFIVGGKGDDFITGGYGNDTLTGGSGNDTFIFDADSGHDIITDIMQQDTLEFQGQQYDMNDMIFKENQDGDVQISFQGNEGQSVTLEGVKYADLDTNHDGDVSESYSVTQTDDGFKVNIDPHNQ